MNEEPLFQEALSRPAAERATFLDSACAGDPALRSAVEALLADYERSANLLDVPPSGPDPTVVVPRQSPLDVTADHDPGTAGLIPAPTADYHPPAETGALIAGRYAPLEKIGEGGMGEVWVAQQSEPVRRKVALKLIKPGMDSRAVLQRFEQERQALALMDHPNIAKVLDAGLTPTGQPFFVMELVNGPPLTRFCDEARLTPRQRLELFVPICQAVQHAHQKGIVHRDLKPANILVTMVDGRPMPKVIDFGVAKATAGKLTDESMNTQFGAVVGTLEYMSPEQAGFSGEDVDTRADIYSLGVILYEALTGLRPIDAGRLRKAALTEMIRIVREEEPSKPSTRLSTDESLPSLAALRGTDPRRLMALLRGDLDWIVMKCLEKPRERRYETANGLARDVQRYLDDEPVEARPPGAGYRIGKFVRRHRGPVAAAALIVLALVGGIIGTTWGLVRADRALRAEAVQRDRAESREEQAIDAVKRFGDAVATNPELKNNPSLEPLREALLKEPIAFFGALRDQLQADDDTRPEALQRLASAASELGGLTNEIGDKLDALRIHQESLAILERLAREYPAVPEYESSLARAHGSIGPLQAATGRHDEALASYERAIEILERQAREETADADLRVELAANHYNLGVLRSQTGKPDDALISYERALEIRERLASENPSDTAIQNALAKNLNAIGALRSATGRPDDALAAYTRAVGILERLAREKPGVTEFQTTLAASHNNMGVLRSQTGRSDDALDSFTRAHEIRERLARENPSVTQFQNELANSYQNLGFYHYKTGRFDEALASYTRSIEILERLARENPAVTEIQNDLATTHGSVGSLNDETGRFDDALASYTRAIDVLDRLARENPSVTQFRRDLAVTLNNLGVLHTKTGRHDDALAAYTRALGIRERLAREHPESPEFASELGTNIFNFGVVDIEARRFGDAHAKLLEAIDWQRKALDANPRNPEYRRLLMNGYKGLILACDGLNDAAGSADARRQLAELQASDPRLLELDTRLSSIEQGAPARDNPERLALAQRAYDTGRYALAAGLWGEALEADPSLGEDRQAGHRYNAACAAALAASDAGNDGPPDDAARSELRRQALRSLQGEMESWRNASRSGGTADKDMIAAKLAHWTRDPDLAGVRDEPELAKLTESEREEWRSLWTEVEALSKPAQGPTP